MLRLQTRFLHTSRSCRQGRALRQGNTYGRVSENECQGLHHLKTNYAMFCRPAWESEQKCLTILVWRGMIQSAVFTLFGESMPTSSDFSSVLGSSLLRVLSMTRHDVACETSATHHPSGADHCEIQQRGVHGLGPRVCTNCSVRCTCTYVRIRAYCTNSTFG